MTNLKRHIGYFSLLLGLVSTPINAKENINKAAKNEVTSFDEKQIDCLAKNIYRESGGESIRGKYAVGAVVMNRVRSGKFASTPCGVIYQRSSKGCQFSWVCSKKNVSYDRKLLAQCREIAKVVYYNRHKDETRGALFFHANSVKPKWSKGKKSIVIGRHIFY